MPIKSQYASKCKDCGIPYEVGDEISTNGNKSPNKSGELKDHWCKNGKNCQGVMPLQGSGDPSDAQTSQDRFFISGDKDLLPETSKEEPTPEEIMKFVKENSDVTDETAERIIHDARAQAVKVLIEKAGIEDIMNKAGIKHPSRVSFMGEVMRRLS